jgi:thiamine biosynthesis lipoprotein
VIGLSSTSFAALGTTATVAVTEAAALEPARAELERELCAIDLACSRFRADSELRRVEQARGAEIETSELFAEALATALRAAALTCGLVTPAIGGPLAVSGYDRDFSELRPSLRPVRFRAAPDWSRIALDRPRRTVRLPSGIRLDLGATAKALAADRAAEAIAAQTGGGVLVSLGGDIRVAGPAPAHGWPILVDDAHDVATPEACSVAIRVGGLATSSTTVRRWRRAGAELHHVLDPRTGAPAAGPWRTVSVAAATCVDANIASTAALVLGEDATAWLRERRLPSRLVAGDGSVLCMCGWPEEAAGRGWSSAMGVGWRDGEAR